MYTARRIKERGHASLIECGTRAGAGLDTCLAIMRVLHEGLGESKYRPCPLLVQYVDAGWWGKKVGKGVYEYPGWNPKEAKPVPLARF